MPSTVNEIDILYLTETLKQLSLDNGYKKNYNIKALYMNIIVATGRSAVGSAHGSGP